VQRLVPAELTGIGLGLAVWETDHAALARGYRRAHWSYVGRPNATLAEKAPARLLAANAWTLEWLKNRGRERRRYLGDRGGNAHAAEASRGATAPRRRASAASG